MEELLSKIEFTSIPTYKYNHTDIQNNIQNNITPCIFKYHDLISFDSFLKIIRNHHANYGPSGQVTRTKGKVLINDILDDNNNIINLNNNYIFDDCFQKNIVQQLFQHIIYKNNSIIQNLKTRVVNIYAANKNTGAILHNHTGALNYLIKGKKLWLMIPPHEHYIKFIRDNGFHYGEIKEEPCEWFINNYEHIRSHIPELIIIQQNEKDIVYVPHRWFHHVVNLEDSFGITYSWFPNDFPNLRKI